MTDYEMLKNYSEEIGLVGYHFTLETLINSHRRLRNANIENNLSRVQDFRENFERAKQAATEAINHGEYINVERLKSMTMKEIVEFLGE